MKYKNPQQVSRTTVRLVYFVLCILIGVVQANEQLSGPQKIIQDTSDRLQENLGKEPLRSNFTEAYQFVDEVISPHLDIDRISFLALGKHWKRANDQQRDQFQKEFKALIMRTYTRTFLEYSDWNIRYLSLRESPDKTKVIVKTEIMQGGAPPIGVDYRMKRINGNWQVYDVITEGVSLIINYRTSFKNEIARSGSIDSIITSLAERNRKALKVNGV